MKKTLLGDGLRERISTAEVELQKLKEALRLLDENGMDNAVFVVHIFSSWDEPDVRVAEQLPLQKVIQKAEAEFMATNKRSDVQGRYFVYIVLGEIEIMVPDKLWRKFTQKK